MTTPKTGTVDMKLEVTVIPADSNDCGQRFKLIADSHSN